MGTVNEVDEVGERRWRSLLPHASPTVRDEWAAIEPSATAVTHARALHGAGVSPQDAAALFRILDAEVIGSLSQLIDASRMAAIDPAHVLLWAASDLLRPEWAKPIGTRRNRLVFTSWVTAARRYVNAARGDQYLAALCAAARLSADEVAAGLGDGTLDLDAIRLLAALNTKGPPP